MQKELIPPWRKKVKYKMKLISPWKKMLKLKGS